MRKMADRWQDLFEFTSDAIFMLDQDWRIVGLNPKAEALSGWKAADVEGKLICTDLFLCHSLDGQELCNQGCPKQLAYEGQKSGEPIKVKLTHKNGRLTMLGGRGLFLPVSGEKQGGTSPLAAILVHDEEDRQKLQETLMEKGQRDPLTGLFNRQYFEELYGIEIKRARRHGGIVALLMLNVRDLRGINTQHGAQAGDKVLKAIGQMLPKCMREVDIAARHGNDRFVVLLYGADQSKSETFVQRLKHAFEKLNQSGAFPQPVQLDYALTVSDQNDDQLLSRIEETLEKRQGQLL